MGDPILELGNAANWRSVGWHFDDKVTPLAVNASYYQPFPEITCPLLLNRHTLACQIVSVDVKPHWRFGGWINHKVQTGLVGAIPETYAESQKLWLNRITLVRLQKLSSDFAISFSVPYWLLDLKIYLWEYIGTEGDATEAMLMDIESQLADIQNQLGV